MVWLKHQRRPQTNCYRSCTGKCEQVITMTMLLILEGVVRNSPAPPVCMPSLFSISTISSRAADVLQSNAQNVPRPLKRKKKTTINFET